MFFNINNNTAPSVSITWHKREPLGCAVYSLCPTCDSYKPFGTLQRVIKSQRVLVSRSIWIQQKSISLFSERFVAKFSDLFSNFQVSWKGNYLKKLQTIPTCSFQEKMACLVCPYEETYPHIKLHIETSSYFAGWFDFLKLTSYQVNKTGQQKLIHKYWSSGLASSFLDMSSPNNQI